MTKNKTVLPLFNVKLIIFIIIRFNYTINSQRVAPVPFLLHVPSVITLVQVLKAIHVPEIDQKIP